MCHLRKFAGVQIPSKSHSSQVPQSTSLPTSPLPNLTSPYSQNPLPSHPPTHPPTHKVLNSNHPDHIVTLASFRESGQPPPPPPPQQPPKADANHRNESAHVASWLAHMMSSASQPNPAALANGVSNGNVAGTHPSLTHSARWKPPSVCTTIGICPGCNFKVRVIHVIEDATERNQSRCSILAEHIVYMHDGHSK